MTDKRNETLSEAARLVRGFEAVVGLTEEGDAAAPKTFTYQIDLDERGVFKAHVDDPDGKTVYSISNEDEDPETGETSDGETPEVRDGFMKHGRDVKGLEQHLKELGVIPKDANLEISG